MNATELLSEVERIDPAVFTAAEFALGARMARGEDHRWPAYVVDQVGALKAAGLGRRRIAKRLGMHPNTVRGMLARSRTASQPVTGERAS